MARKFSKTELKIVAEEIYTQLRGKFGEKRKEIDREHKEKFEKSEEFQKYLECLALCNITLDSDNYTKNRLHLHFRRMFEEVEPKEHVPFNPPNVKQILHELCLEQIRQGEDFNLDELINKYIEKYA